ncbi:MAG TPA: glycosyltransferase family 39 protein [Candidatus Acidoferrales bacterium]|nr:glycosyltransferase family 39 protein [Candidatus Acidoferrales bacterium]
MRSASSIPRPARLIALLLLLLFALQAFWAACEDSVTIDEFVHLPLGLYMLRSADFRHDPINPPLARMLAALPLLVDAPRFDPGADTPHWAMGTLFMQANAGDYQAFYVRARCVTILLACVLGGLIFVWASRLYGADAGLMALFFFALSPDMLAHGHLVTLDVPGALGVTASAFALWRLLERPTWASASVLGAALGVATLFKLSGIIMVAVVPVAIVVSTLRESGRPARPSIRRWLGLMVAAALVFVCVLNLGYGFRGTLASLDQATLRPNGLLATVRAAFPSLRVPAPLSFVNGVDLVMTTGVGVEPSYFLAGRLSSSGWWYYHLVAFALKTPLPVLAVTLIALVLWIIGRAPGARSYCVFIPVLLIFAFNSVFNSQDIGVRHVLPALPLLFIAIAPLLTAPLRAIVRGRRPATDVTRAVIVACTLAWFVAGTVRIAPRYLQYFNEIAGGPANGHRFLIDSNVDWGQDLIRLKRYMDARSVPSVNLAYFGRVDPRVYGIAFVPLDERSAHGPTVASASFLMGRPYFWYVDGRLQWVKPGTFTWLQAHRPIDRVGSMFVYDLP